MLTIPQGIIILGVRKYLTLSIKRDILSTHFQFLKGKLF